MRIPVVGIAVVNHARIVFVVTVLNLNPVERRAPVRFGLFL
jgi:hypothetical protein